MPWRDRSAPEQIWFGPADTPLAGALHRPEGPVRGSVVVCPPFGYEATCAGRTLRTLADHLAQVGLLTLRLQYSGTGNSGGPNGLPDELDRWVQSVVVAVEHLEWMGLANPALIGLRLGAALASAARARLDTTGPTVLWTPVVSGPAAARELRGLAAITPGPARHGDALNVLGSPVNRATITRLKDWRPYDALTSTERVLLVHDPGWPGEADFGALVKRLSPLNDVLVEAGAAQILQQDAEMVTTPAELVRHITAWVAENVVPMPAPHRTTPAPIPVPSTVRVDLTQSDGPMVETMVRFGHRRLAGVITEPMDREPGDACQRNAVVFLNNGVAGSSGPARLWVHFARELTRHGVTSLRLDLQGLGDSPDPRRLIRPIRRESSLRRQSGGDAAAAIDEMRTRGFDRITLVGLCSGAYLGLAAAAYLPSPPDAVLAVNPPMYHAQDLGVGPAVRRMWIPTGWALTKRPARRFVHGLPRWILLGADRVRLFPAADREVRAAARRSDVALVFSEGGKEHSDLVLRSRVSIDRLQDAASIKVHVVPEMDHSIFDLRFRAQVFEILRRLGCVENREREARPRLLLPDKGEMSGFQ